MLEFILADGGRSPSYILRLAWLHKLSTQVGAVSRSYLY